MLMVVDRVFALCLLEKMCLCLRVIFSNKTLAVVLSVIWTWQDAGSSLQKIPVKFTVK